MSNDQTTSPSPSDLPLAGIRVVEFSHMVMGPTCGMILGDLGAEVIKVEPTGGDNTRKLPGVACGFFRTFNRNKKSFPTISPICSRHWTIPTVWPPLTLCSKQPT